jgi:hypothetical protein
MCAVPVVAFCEGEVADQESKTHLYFLMLGFNEARIAQMYVDR